MFQFSARSKNPSSINRSDRKSTRLNSSHSQISYAVFCLKKKKLVYHGEDAIGQGGALVLWAATDAGLLRADSLAERGNSSSRVGEEAAASLRPATSCRTT